MLRVGLTGGLGSGKSTVARLFSELGVRVIEADAVGRALMQQGQPLYAAIVQQFGQEIVRQDGALDRAALANLAFQQGRLEELNRLVHPPVIAAQEERMRSIFAQDPTAIAMVESALIFEAERSGTVPGWRQRFDRLILVSVADEIKVERYVARIRADHAMDEAQLQKIREDARARLAAQIPDGEKKQACDYVIDTSGTLEDTATAVKDVFTKLRKDAGAGIESSVAMK